MKHEGPDLLPVLIETYNAAAAMCRAIVEEDSGTFSRIMDKVGDQYDGFGVRAKAAIEATERARREEGGRGGKQPSGGVPPQAAGGKTMRLLKHLLFRWSRRYRRAAMRKRLEER